MLSVDLESCVTMDKLTSRVAGSSPTNFFLALRSKSLGMVLYPQQRLTVTPTHSPSQE